ncbi:uncharacterized protein K444DRAFT_88276 [Hyaloscypha bicolor E]|uniref:GS catalytic domain-containing protein n=1 Tax=Hyaloscypha bicolor E TaxID=1095630 RepID=A0A2J6SXF1_9HELO|nr:uncharacterized protein K444DRAFT_88276 [Hyaloscypha bicolor E]PMD55421.1 hypothetical protein K444DRAFT_88276 [Hyaloscypha bicolor E]
MIGELARKLSLVDAAAEKFHTELGPGQKAFGLLPRILVEAVNMLLRARETITIIAHQHRLRATLHPLPYPKYADTGVHTRISAIPLKHTTSLRKQRAYSQASWTIFLQY